MATGTLLPLPFTGFDDNGDPVPGGKVYTYEAGSTTPLATYSDSALTTANANPTILDSAGRATIYLWPANYKIVLKSAADATIWTRDNVSALAPYSFTETIYGVAGESLSGGSVVYLNNTSGARIVGYWYKADADTAEYSTTPRVIGIVPSPGIVNGATGLIHVKGRVTGLSGLTAGPYYVSATAGGLSAVATVSNVRYVGTADSSTSIVLSDNADASRFTAAGIGSLVTLTGTTLANPAMGVFTVTVTSATSTPKLAGIATTPAGQLLLVINGSGASFTVFHEDAGQTAAYRIVCPGSADKTITANSSFLLFGDVYASRWRMVGV